MKKLLIIVAFVITATLSSSYVFAVKPSVLGSGECAGVAPGESVICDGQVNAEGKVGGIFDKITYWILFFAGIVAVIMIIFSSIKYMTASGDAAKVSSAKKTLLYSIIGLAIVVLSASIAMLVQEEVGLQFGSADEKKVIQEKRAEEAESAAKEAAKKKAKQQK